MNNWKASVGAFDVNSLINQLPFLAIVGFALILLLLEAFMNKGSRKFLMYVTLFGCAAALFLCWLMWRKIGGLSMADPAIRIAIEQGAPPPRGEAHFRELFGGLLIFDRFGIFMNVVFLIGAALTALLLADYMQEHGFEFGEAYSLLLFAVAGMMLLAAANDLVTVFLGIETMSLAVYVLTGAWRRSTRSAEAAMKYFLMGAFATGFLLYGMALIYGVTGATNLRVIAALAVKSSGNPLFLIGVFFVLSAFAFKVAAVPFHMWAPDTYEGAPTPISAFMSAGVKAAAFAGILRFFGHTLGAERLVPGPWGWGSILLILALVTMVFGNLAAMRQENIKRLLAYSSIAHAGVLLVGVVAMGFGSKSAEPAVLYYLLAYTFTTLGAFGVVAWLGNRGDERLMIDDWAGLGSRHPMAAFAMTLFLLSLGGIPPTAGFFGKFYIFRSAMEAHVAMGGKTTLLLALVIVGVLSSAVSIFYYLRVVMAMYFREPSREMRPLKSTAAVLALVGALIFVLQMGLFPSRFLSIAAESLAGS